MNLQNTIKFNFFAEKNRKLVTFLCYFLPFAVLGGYLASLILRGFMIPSSGYYLIHYLYTYDHGFIARGFIGEVLSWFFETVSDELTEYVATIFSILLTIALSFSIGKALSKTKDNPEHFFIVAILSTLSCLCPVGFHLYCMDNRFDKLIWAIALFSVFLAGRKFAIWLVPVLCIIATLINPVFLFTSMILVAIVLLYYFYSSNYSVKNGIICAVSYLSMIALGVFALISEKQHGFASASEMVDYYFARYEGELSKGVYDAFVNVWLIDYFADTATLLEQSYESYYKVQHSEFFVDLIFLIFPTYLLTVTFWKKCIKLSDNKFQKFIFFLCAISPVVYIPIALLVFQTSKYFYNNLFVQVGLMIFFVTQNNTAVSETFKKAFEWAKRHLVVSAIISVYILSVVIL